jgi:hypothetical protein
VAESGAGCQGFAAGGGLSRAFSATRSARSLAAQVTFPSRLETSSHVVLSHGPPKSQSVSYTFFLCRRLR